MNKAWLAAATLCAASASACELPGGTQIESARYVVVYRSLPEGIPVGAHFALDLAVCPKADAPPPDSVRVDARMPEHRHGMNYKASVKREAAGRYRADGLLFHMPGRWELVFDVRGGGATDQLTRSVQVQ